MNIEKQRKQKFTDWKEPRPHSTIFSTVPDADTGTNSHRRILLGEGKYGKIYADGTGVVTKEVTARGNKRGMASPFREKIVAILQSLLVMRNTSPHFPLHYGFEMTPIPNSLKCNVSYLIEEWESSLENIGMQLLANDQTSWVHMVFQIMSAITTYSTVFDISHNDLYPRNILVKRFAQPEPYVYDIFGTRYEARYRFILAITDFGIASSTLMGNADHCAEVAASLKDQPVGNAFGTIAPSKHILYYKSLPPYARDVYTVLKWIVFPSKRFQCNLGNVVSWCANALATVDKNQGHFVDPQAIARLLQFMFTENASRYRLEGVITIGKVSEPQEMSVPDWSALDSAKTELVHTKVASNVEATQSFKLDTTTKEPLLEDATKLLQNIEY